MVSFGLCGLLLLRLFGASSKVSNVPLAQHGDVIVQSVGFPAFDVHSGEELASDDRKLTLELREEVQRLRADMSEVLALLRQGAANGGASTEVSLIQTASSPRLNDA